MTKELKALKSIYRTIQQLDYGFVSKEDEENFQIIETTLKRSEELEIENSKQFKEKWVQDNLAMTFELNVANRKLKALEIIKECLVSEFKLFERDGEYFILFYFDELHQLTFKLKNKEEYELLKEVLL